MANYFLNDDGSLTKKNKKKKGNNYILDSNGKLTLNPSEEEELTKKEAIKTETPKRSWFNTGALEDGYQFGDITKSVIATKQDINENLTSGVARIGEGVIDLGAYAVGGVANILGSKKLADSTKKFIARNLVDEYKVGEKLSNFANPSASLTTISNKILNKGKTDELSVLGEKSDSLVQSAGQLAGTFGLQAVGVPWWLTTGVTSFSGGTEEAFKDDASYGKAGAYGLISAGAEILTEKLSGGISFGGKTLDDVVLKPLTDKIANKTVKTLTKLGLDAVGEGFEEFATEVIQNVGKKLTYEDEKTWNELLTSEEAMEGYLEAAIGGAVLGGGMNVGKAATSIKTGRDYDTGLTDNEQRIVDKEIETRKAEAQKEGKKLSNKEIAKIEEQVKNDLQKGYISTDLIESEFGGEEYKAYKSALDKKTAIESEIKELENKPYAELTVKENERLQAIREELKGIDTNTLKSNLESSMADKIAKDGYLQNSYHEKNKKSVKFNADLTKYDAKQQETIQKAIDSGILNDTNKTHEFVDMIAKISADKGVSFDFANNQKLKDSGFAIEGKQVNGFINENGITLNMDSAKALNKVVGHEITHVLEGTELYTELQNALMEYDITKKEYGTRYNELKKLYKGVKDADIKKELTADLVGDYIFNDPDFVNNLSAKKPNVFKKIYDEIKYLFKIATAGSKEARQLEKVKKIFEDAYKQSATQTDTNARYSIQEATDGSKYVNIDTDQHIFDGKTVAEQNKIAKEYILNTFRENGLIADGKEIKVNNKTATKYTNPRENISDSKKRVKNRISTELDNLLNVSKLIKTEADQKNHSFAKDGWEYYLTTFKVNDSYFTGVANVGVNGDTRTLYDINQIKKTTHNDKAENTAAISIESSLYDNNISQNENIVNNSISKNTKNDTEYSLSDSNEQIAPSRNDIYGSDIKLQVEEAIAPLKEELAPVKDEYRALTEEELPYLEQQYEEDFKNIDESYAPIEAEDTTPEIEDEITATKSLEDVRDFDEIGSRKVKAYQYENPEVRPYFQEMATYMLGDLENSVKGERSFNDQLYYDTAGEQGFYGTTRQTTDDIAELLDSKYNYSYKDIRKGLEAIIEDHGAENIAVAKRIEFALDKRLREGYTDVSGYEIPANEEYLKLMEEKEIENYYNSLPIDESMIPPEEELAPVVIASNKQVTDNVVPFRQQLKENSVVEEKPTRVEQQTAQILSERPTPKNKDKKLKAIATVNLVDKGYYISKLARQTDNRQLDALWDNTLLSNAQAQEVIGEGRFRFNEDTKTYDKVGDSVYEIFEGLETTNKVKDFNEYMYHKLNIERMSLEDKAQLRMKELKETTLKDYTNEDIDAMAKTKLREDAKQELVDLVEAAKEYKSLSKVKNKPVFGFTTDANKSIEIVNSLEQNNPEFSDYAKKVYDYESGTYSDLSLLVESGILSQEDANYYRNKYESYVPIIRDIEADTMEKQMFGKRASVGNAVKSATGGSQNIIPLKDAMAIKTMLVQRSANLNKLGLELMYVLNPVVESETVSAENIIEDISGNKDLIQAGTNGKAPTMTVYEHGVKHTFEIPVEIYEALKTNYDSFSKVTIKPLNAFSSFKRNVLTQYNPFFMVTNMIKDAQDVLINSQHPATTYKAIPEAIAQLKNKGYWYKEMQAQGLFQDTYYDNQGGFDTTKKGVEKLSEFYPLKKIAEINDFIERVPRMAEYIASRKAGRSVEVASLDASRVTTNFKAGGDWTKFLNRNGATFLNASVQGALQQVRNVQEAHQKGLKGYMALATKFTIAALPAILLNNLIWDDDDEYEELSDYIKDNYYIIGKYGDGQFIRIPKGRMTAVIQKTIEEMQNLVTGNDEADLGSYLELVANNLAPSNPIENNIFSPFINTKLFSKDDAGTTWYGEDLVPTRLQDKPAAEQYDETTDEFSKWLGEKLNLSPIKINNLIDQNTGVIGDLLLPMMTAEAKTKNDNPIMAGIEDKFTADVVFDNKYSTDFYSVKEDLAKKSNSYEATDEDVLKTKYMNSKQAQMNDIYAEIRKVQNSDLDKKTKYAQVRDLREQLNDIAETSLNDYKKVNIESNYAKVGEIEFRKNDSGEWQKITSKQLEKQNEAINTLGASANNYWENKDEYDYAIENPTKYNAISQIDTYDNYIKYKDDIANIKEQYEGYSTAQRKAAVQEYIESLSLSIPKKIMLEKLAGGYSIKAYEDYMFQYIESLPMSAAEKQELHKQLFD